MDTLSVSIDGLDLPTTGKTCPAGSFRYWFADQRWEWSDEVAALHGYPPGEVAPSTELLLSHKHPDDRAIVAEILHDVVTGDAPFCSRHRIIDAQGVVRPVLVVGDQMADEQGRVVGSVGYYIDLTDTVDEARNETLDETMPEVVAARAVIDQAKGMLMLVYGISEEQAFRVLRWRSQETNTKVRDLAARLIATVARQNVITAPTRTRFDHALLTAHECEPEDRMGRSD